MIVLERDGGLTLIRQTEHARLCGVMLEAWGAAGFQRPGPFDAILLAAAEHDNGWREWEDAPRLNPTTGRPHTYIDIPIEQHLAIYRRGIARALVLNPYTGLMVSMHGSLLYSRFRADQPGSTEFLAEQRALHERLLRELSTDGRFADYCDESRISANRDLLFGLDTLSLFLCHGEAWEDSLDFPHGGISEPRPVALSGEDRRWRLDPYPFLRPLKLSIAVIQVSATRFPDDGELRKALAAARPNRLEVWLEPAGR